MRVGDARDLAAGVEMLGEAGRAGVGVGSNAGIMLIVVLEGERVFGIDDPIEVGDGLIGEEISGADSEGVFGEVDCRDETVGGGDQELAVGELVVEQAEGDGVDVARGGADCRINLRRLGKIARESGAIRGSGAVDEGG